MNETSGGRNGTGSKKINSLKIRTWVGYVTLERTAIQQHLYWSPWWDRYNFEKIDIQAN